MEKSFFRGLEAQFGGTETFYFDPQGRQQSLQDEVDWHVLLELPLLLVVEVSKKLYRRPTGRFRILGVGEKLKSSQQNRRELPQVRRSV